MPFTPIRCTVPRRPDGTSPEALRLVANNEVNTPRDARRDDSNYTISKARLILATTGLHAQLRTYDEKLRTYDETQPQASTSYVGSLPSTCLLLRIFQLCSVWNIFLRLRWKRAPFFCPKHILCHQPLVRQEKAPCQDNCTMQGKQWTR